MTMTMMTPQASFVFRQCTMASSMCSLSLLVSVIVLIGFVLPKCPSQSWCSPTSKELHMYSPTSMSALSSSSSSATTLLPMLPSQSFSPMNRDEIDRGHQHRRDCHTPHRRRHGARCHSDDRVEKDPIPGSVGGRHHHIRRTPPPLSPPLTPMPPLTWYHSES